jgi:hypothetical protein
MTGSILAASGSNLVIFDNLAYIVIPMHTMTAKQYRAALDKLGISQLAAGELFGVGARTSRRWALDEARVPAAVAMMLRLMLDRQLKLTIPVMNEATRQIDRHQIWAFSATSKWESIHG